jgi:hypothetical protein
MSDAYIETTVLTDFLLKPKTPKQERAKAALARYENTLLPVYSIKEWKAGPLDYFAYLHDKLVVTQSLRDTFQALSALGRGSYRQATSMEALAAAATTATTATVSAGTPTKKYQGLGSSDREMADSYRLALESLIIRSWRKRRRITTQIVDELSCYIEVEPRVGKDGLLDLKPQQCERDQECCLSPQLKAKPTLLAALRNAIPEHSGRAEDQKRRKALKQLIKHPKEIVNRETCRDLGDAIFAFFCPTSAVILTTNLRDHEPLAKSIGKRAEKP